MSEHDSSHILDQIEAYLAGGLEPDERLTLETHVAGCAQCTAALSEARDSDARLQQVFGAVRPAFDLEDRLVHHIRMARGPRRRLIHPMVLRSAAATAAAVLLAGTGLAVTNVLDGNGNPLATFNGGTERSSIIHQMKKVTVAQNPRAFADWGEINRDGSNRWEGKPVSGSKPRVVIDKYDTTTYPTFAAPADGDGVADVKRQNATLIHYVTADQNGRLNDLSGTRSFGVPPPANQPAASLPAIEPTLATVAPAGSFKPTELLTLGDEAVLKLGGQVVALKPGSNSNYAGIAATGGDVAGKAVLGDGAKAADVPPAAPQQPAPMPSMPPPANTNPSTSPAPIGRKVIRNGTMEFEVDRFDDAVMRITKLVNEQQGFVATTDSDKLPNGHMKGTLTLRVPPERLDTLVLTLRGVGDLKSQKIAAEDVTKHYTDLDSQLRAARAMEERLLGLIKSGQGQIKDLLAAEKELGVWREKIESIEGEKRYLDNQVSLSTLVVGLYEKDIHTPASASESEQVQMSLETEAVDDAYNKALEAIRGAKGRITQSELKQFDAGQLGATIVAAIPPDASEQVIARLRQLNGRIAHFARDRHQTTKDGTPAPAAVIQVEREDTIVSLQIYNLANIAPRRTTTLQVATATVDKAYAQAIEQARAAGGRVVTSSLARPDPNTQVADLDLQVPTEKADAVLDAIRTSGETMRQELTENPDTANVTEAKRGIHVRLISLAAVPARETQTLQLAATNVSTAFNDILNAAKSADARVFQSDLTEQNPQEITAAITIEIPRSAEAAINAAIGKASQVLTRTINRSTEPEKTVDTKVRLALSLISADRMPPRQMTTEQIQVADVGRATDDLVSAATSAGGRQIGTGGSEQNDARHDTSHVVVEVPLSKLDAILDDLDRAGARRGKQVSFDSNVPDGPLARARIDVTFSNSPTGLGGEETTWDALRNGLALSGRGLRWSLQLLVIGFCFVAPWVLAIWALWRFARRSRQKPARA